MFVVVELYVIACEILRTMPEGCLHDLLEQQARRFPERAAFVCGEARISYRELRERVHLLSRALQRSGCDQGARVGILFERSFEFVVALYGTLEAGCVCVPLDPADSAERRALVLRDADIQLVLSTAALAPLLDGTAARVLLGEHWEKLGRAPTFDRVVQPDEPAFILYSRDESHGAVLTHRALLAGLIWLQETFSLTGNDRQLLRTTHSLREVFWPVMHAGTCVILPPSFEARLASVVAEVRVSVLVLGPDMLETLLAQPAFAAAQALRYVVCTSRHTPGDLPERFFELGLRAELYNLYGVSEAMYARYWRCQRGQHYRSFVPAGLPAELESHVLDEHLQPMAAGQVGRLYLGGRGLTAGYWKRPELNASKLIANPLRSPHAPRLFATGDLARLQADGTLELLDHADDQPSQGSP